MLVTDGLYDALQTAPDKEFLLEGLMKQSLESIAKTQEEIRRYYMTLLTGKGKRSDKRTRVLSSVSDDITFSLWSNPFPIAAGREACNVKKS